MVHTNKHKHSIIDLPRFLHMHRLAVSSHAVKTYHEHEVYSYKGIELLFGLPLLFVAGVIVV